MPSRTRFRDLLALALLACSSDESETDSAQTVYELEEPRAGPRSIAGFALVEVDEGVMMVVGRRVVHVAKGTHAATTIHEAARVHSALGIDDKFVYFATQRPDRLHYATFTKLPDDGEPDGYMYRVQRRAPFTAEKLAPVGILTGHIEVKSGRIHVCSSHGINDSGSILELATASPRSAAERVIVGYNQFCQSVVADEDRLYFTVDQTYGPKRPSAAGLVLETMTPGRATPQELLVTEVKGIHDLLIRKGELVLLSGTDALFVSKEGKVRETMRAGTLGLLAPLGEAGWVWSKDSNQSAELGRVCQQGRLYAGATTSAGRELTQNVCYVRAITAGAAGLWFLEYADIIEVGGPGSLRYRLKLLPSPQL